MQDAAAGALGCVLGRVAHPLGWATRPISGGNFLHSGGGEESSTSESSESESESSESDAESEAEAEVEAWAAFYQWCIEQTWGPSSEYTGLEQVQRLMNKKRELGL